MFESLLSLGVRLAAAAVALGWGLSAFGCLSATGYLVLGLPLLAAAVFSVDWRPLPRAVRLLACRPLGWVRRCRVLPLIFLFAATLILLGSALHAPNNFDGLNYRAPKVLHWLDQHRWHWVHTPTAAINYTLPNYEWLTAPLYLATGGFHLTVVINWACLAAMPGLFFALLRALGASRRTAWHWMWLFPLSGMVALQAGSIGNDLAGMTAALAALYWAVRFTVTGSSGHLFDALLAAAFCTGVKISNLPLAVLPGIVLARQPLQVLARRAALAGGMVIGLATSGFIPMLLNRAHTGTILGAPTGTDQVTNPLAALIGNTLILIENSFAPPLFPGARQLTAWLDPKPGIGFFGWIQSHYWKFSLRLGELPQEEAAGLGIGVTLGMLLCLALWWRSRAAFKRFGHPAQLLSWQRLLFGGWVAFAFLVLLLKLGLGAATARVTMPYLTLVLAIVLGYVGCDSATRGKLWQWVSPLLALSIIPALLITPSRPLIPPSAMFQMGHKLHLGDAALTQLQRVYEVYAQRPDPFIEMRQSLPADARTLVLVTDGFEPTAALWKPYGARRCEYWMSDAEVRTALDTATQPVYVLLKEEGCKEFFHQDIAAWMQSYHATPVLTFERRIFAANAPNRYTLARIEPARKP
jgi:hypothetical protein